MLQVSVYQSQNMYPFLYVHSVYSNMIEKLMAHSNSYWSLYMQPGNGQMVMIKYEPEIYIEQREIIVNDSKSQTTAEHNPRYQVVYWWLWEHNYAWKTVV